MKTTTTDFKAAAHKFFAAYDAHDVEGMLALCADGAQGRYLPYGKNSAMPIRGGLETIWRADRAVLGSADRQLRRRQVLERRADRLEERDRGRVPGHHEVVAPADGRRTEEARIP